MRVMRRTNNRMKSRFAALLLLVNAVVIPASLDSKEPAQSTERDSSSTFGDDASSRRGRAASLWNGVLFLKV